MRADRLLSLLMLLQNRGRMTAQSLAGELEVSERTIYRDVNALCISGVPVFTEHGPGGGFDLLDSYRTNLTGLNTGELQALFALSIPAPLTELGLRQDFQSALLKLSASLPANHRQEEQRIRGRIHLDWEGWSGMRYPTPYLGVIHRALFSNRQVIIRYPLIFGTVVEKAVHPLGLVTKSGVWYLVCEQNGHIKVHTVSDLIHAEICPQTSQRPGEFKLDAFWKKYCQRVEEHRSYYAVTVRLHRDTLPELERITEQHADLLQPEPGGLQTDETVDVRLRFISLLHARNRLMGFGGAIEVIQPKALRLSMADFAEQIIQKYRAVQVV